MSGASADDGGHPRADNSQRQQSLAKWSELPPERIRYFAAADENVVASIRCGVLFLMAFWSGPAVAAFVNLTRTIARLDPIGAIEVVVVDFDNAEHLIRACNWPGNFTGAGEAAWIHHGKFIATTGIGPNFACHGPHTLRLLEMPW